jgi:hypothetical protein
MTEKSDQGCRPIPKEKEKAGEGRQALIQPDISTVPLTGKLTCYELIGSLVTPLKPCSVPVFAG